MNFFHTSCPPEQASGAFEKLRDNYFTPWLRRMPRPRISELEPPTYAWAIENVAGHTHVHWWLYLPERLKALFEVKLPYWLKAVGAEMEADEALHVEKVTKPRGMAKYMMKGVNPKCARRYHIRPEAQGEVTGKRCGVSKSLGPTAQLRHRQAADGTRVVAKKVA